MSAEQTLLDALKQYEEGVQQSVQQTLQTGQLDAITAQITSRLAASVPGASQAKQLAQGVQAGLATLTGGQYSGVSRYVAAIQSQGLLGMIKFALNSSRTYNTDQYWGAVYYWRYVEGQNVDNQSQIGDQQVLQALEWFITKLGVFISGREHLEALQRSAQDYMNYHNVNSYTTIDQDRVNAAVIVMQTYMPDTGFSGTPGKWAYCIGVYDQQLGSRFANMNAQQQNIAVNNLPIAGPAFPPPAGSVRSGITLSVPVVAIAAASALFLIVLIWPSSKK